MTWAEFRDLITGLLWRESRLWKAVRRDETTQQGE